MNLALSCPRCGRRRTVANRRAEFGIPCTSCYEYMDVDRTRPPGRRGRGRSPREECPWTPWQVAASGILFGVGAGGAVAGFNFLRLGKPRYLIPCIIGGAVLFIAAALTIAFAVPAEFVRLAAILANFGAGLGFMLVQMPHFHEWRAKTGRLKSEEPYRPNGLGRLLLVGLVSLGIEIVIVAPIIIRGILQ